MKYQIVENCLDCKYYNSFSEYCHKLERDIVYDIPEDCPLDDYPETVTEFLEKI